MPAKHFPHIHDTDHATNVFLEVIANIQLMGYFFKLNSYTCVTQLCVDKIHAVYLCMYYYENNGV